MYLWQVLVNGVLLGSVYALLGLGMAMIFGIVRLTNLAHGEFVVLGAYVSALFSERLGIDPFLTLLFTVPLLFACGFLLQSALLNPAMRQGAEPALLVSFGISVILQDAMLLLFSADARHLSAPYRLRTIQLFGMELSLLQLLLLALSLLCIGGLSLFFQKTYLGRAIRACADDREAAALMGVKVERAYAIAMGLSMATAAVAGLCAGLKWTFYPSSGGQYLLVSFVVVVLGGMGSIPGTLLAGFLFGLVQVAGGANYGLLFSYILLLLVLAIFPSGITGGAFFGEGR